MLDERKQTVQVSLPDEPLWVRADRDRVQQIVSNLLSNAAKYSPDGTEVAIDVRGSGGKLHTRIEDHGIGISRDEVEEVFTPFYRVENDLTRQVSGSGLGMSIAKGIVDLHRGSMSIDSTPLKGHQRYVPHPWPSRTSDMA